MLSLLTRALLIAYAFVVPWEYSLELGEPFGNIARILGVLLILVAVPAAFENKSLRPPGPMQWAVLTFYLFWLLSLLWSADPLSTSEKIRAYFQTMAIVWIVSFFAEGEHDLRWLMRAFVAGSWVLALLTILNFLNPATHADATMRFVAEGQDPNDVARFLDLAFPLAAYLFRGESKKIYRHLGLFYLPLGLFAVLLTASRGGATAAILAILGSLIILAQGQSKRTLAIMATLPLFAVALWFLLPAGVLARLSTVSAEIALGNLNDRVGIWQQGIAAFTNAPWLGGGAGSFVVAAQTAQGDTAHNTPLTILVTGGIVGFALASLILLCALRAALRTTGLLRIAFLTAFVVWLVTSLVGTVEENRTTWLLFALMAFAGELATEHQPQQQELSDLPLAQTPQLGEG